MNKKVPYKKQSVMWSYALLLKSRELAKYLVGKRKDIAFCNPAYVVEREDSKEIMKKILSIAYTDWEEMGFSKGALYCMRKNAKADKAFTLIAHASEGGGNNSDPYMIMQWQLLVSCVTI